MDDMAYGDLGCHGNPHVQTPHLDRLYADATRLTRYCSGPLCTPARAALMTGRHPYRTGAIDTYLGRSIIDPQERTIAHILGDVGYACSLFGKWHLGDNLPSRPIDMGFHEALHHAGGGLGQPANIGRDSYYDPDLARNGQLVSTCGYCTDIFFDAAVDFISQYRQQPWFCYLATNAPHSPLEIAEHWIHPYREMGLPEKWARLYGMIANIDHNVGRLLGHLEAWGLSKQTLVIFTSDHGPCPSTNVDGKIRYNAGLRGKKGSMYEGGVRVPCFWRWPERIPTARNLRCLTNPIDLLPTLAAVTGTSVPVDRQIDGRNLLPLLIGQLAPEDWPDRSICMQWHRGDIPVFGRNAANIRQRYKWYWPENSKRPELYDLEHDVAERHDIARQFPQIVENMQSEYEYWFNDVSTTRGLTPEENYAPPPILIGDARENLTILTRQDWRMYSCKSEGWSDHTPGYWIVDVTRTGPYRITIDLPLMSVDATLRLQCGSWARDVPITGRLSTITCDHVEFTVGIQRLEAVLEDAEGVRWGVRFVRVSGCTPEQDSYCSGARPAELTAQVSAAGGTDRTVGGKVLNL